MGSDCEKEEKQEIWNMAGKEAVQVLQDEFCMAHRLYCACFDSRGQAITRAYGSREERAFLSQHAGEAHSSKLLRQLTENPLEEVAEEEMDCGFLRCSALAVNVDGRLAAAWVILGIIEEKAPEETGFGHMQTLSNREYENSIQFLHVLSGCYFGACIAEDRARKQAKESNTAEKLMEAELRRSEVMTHVVQMLESEKEFEQIVTDILRRVCSFLEISRGCLVRLNQDTDLVDMMCEWHTEAAAPVKQEIQGISREKYPFLTGKPYMISTHSMMPAEFRRFFRERKLTAGIFLPIEVNRQVIMYLTFTENEKERTWEIQDIKFLNDIKKIVQSILAKRITKNSLAGSYLSLEAILENVGCGICVKDMQKDQILFTNERLHSYLPNSLESGMKTLFQVPDQPERGCREYYIADEDKWFDIHYTEIVWVDGRRVSLFTVYDITETKRYQQKVERQANNDFLTGLYNRMRCEQDLSGYVRQAREGKGQGALLYIDLDDFKHINDGLGHRYGDVLLKAISHSLQRIEGIESTCYRMGGDEFIVIVAQDQFARLNWILNDIEEIFAKPWFLKGADYYCTMSMGIVRFPADGDTVQELIKKADIALYEAKKGGKNRCEFYNENAETTSFKRLDLEKNMRNATMNACDEFEVYYQPIRDISRPGNPCTGAEALLRWNSQSLGFISPAEFIPLAEYLGLINPIGTHVLTEACRRCRNWNDSGHPGFKVNVNLSVVQLLQNDIADKVAHVIEETKIKPQNLTLEVTESLAINDMARMKLILGKIKSLGVRVALDDFGTGYSSLNHLREMPIDVIKIDRCFIQDLGKDEFAAVFVKMVAELAKTIGMNLCIEGVETRRQYEILKNMDIQMIQGFYFDRPMRLEEFENKYL